MAIGIVDTTPTSGNSDTDAASYSITPFASITGLAAGQLAIMCVALSTTTAGSTTFTGWTLLHQATDVGHHGSVWYRFVQAGDTTSTSFTFDNQGTATGITWGCVLYSGVNQTTPFLDHAGSVVSLADADDAITTPTVSNTRATSWYVSAFTAVDVNDSVISCTSSGTERIDVDGGEATASRGVAMYDSNGVISASTFSRTGTWNFTATSGDLMGWVGIIQTPDVISAPAETVTASSSVNAGTAALGAPSALASASATANDAIASVGPGAESVTSSVTANSPGTDLDDTIADPEPASATATSYDASVQVVTGESADAGQAAVQGVTSAPTSSVRVFPDNAGYFEEDLMRFAQTIGNGSATSFNVTHNFGSRDVVATVYDAATYEVVLPTSIVHTDTNTVTVAFPSAPATNEYRVVVLFSSLE